MADDPKPPANTPENKGELPEAFRAAQWKPGQSGNPNGRPKKKPITEMLIALFDNQGDEIKAQMLKVFTGKSGMAKVMLLREAAERLEGKVTQQVEHSGEINLTIAERIRKARERAAKR